MYVTEEDYVSVSENALQILQQSNHQRRHTAELAAAEEIFSYLGGRYALEDEYSRTGTKRNLKLVQVFCTLTLYTLGASTKMGRELRSEQYEAAIKWLSTVQSRPINLPPRIDSQGQETQIPVKYGSGKPLKHDW